MCFNSRSCHRTPVGTGDCLLARASNPWVCCLHVVGTLHHQVEAQHTVLLTLRSSLNDQHQRFVRALNDWEVQVVAMDRHRRKLATLEMGVVAATTRLERACDDLTAMQEGTVREERSLCYLHDNLLHYTRRLHELGRAGLTLPPTHLPRGVFLTHIVPRLCWSHTNLVVLVCSATRRPPPP